MEEENTESVQLNGNRTNAFGMNKKPQKDNAVDTDGVVNSNPIGIIETPNKRSEEENTENVQLNGNRTNSIGMNKEPQKDNTVDTNGYVNSNLIGNTENTNQSLEEENTESVQQNGEGTNSLGKNTKPQKDNELDTNGCVNSNQIGIIENTPITRVQKSPFR